MKSAYTPGPWKVNIHETDIEDENGYCVATTQVNGRCYGSGEKLAQDLMNARLIAAAPELLDALKLLRGFSSETGMDEKRVIRKMADDAIAKAEGAL